MKPIKILTFLTALFLSAVSFAQQKPANLPPDFPANFIEAEGGVSLPLGNFGKTSTATSLVSLKGTSSDVHGYAKAGAFGAIDGAWFFSKHFGLGGMFKYGTYNLKGIDSLSWGYDESFDVDTTRTTPTDYKMWSIMPGLYYNLAISGKFAFTARALVGVAYATTPRIYVNIEDGGVTDPPAIQNPSSKAAFAFDLGAGFSYNILKCLAVNLKADYFYTKPDFAITNSARITNAGREVTEYNQPLESVNFSLGVAYQFGKRK